MKIFLLFFFTVGCLTNIAAQTDRAIVNLGPGEFQANRQSSIREVPLKNVDPFLSYFLKWEGAPGEIEIRFSRNKEDWSDWQAMPRDEHSPDLPVSILGSTAARMRYFQVRCIDPSTSSFDIECHFYSPGSTINTSRPDRPEGGEGRSCSDLTPPLLSRSEWCPAGNCGEHSNPAFATPTHLVIHHSAGSNQSSDWPAVVRTIWDFHVNGRGWSDIGYNWLVDPEGRIYHGRSNDAIGAHFCGTNTGTIGICLLGDFTNEVPKAKALDALQELLSWKLCENGIDPLAEVYHASSGKVLPTVIGHRDGCATACPGDLFYPQIPDIRVVLAEGQTTAVRGRGEELPFQVYPNPSRGQFRIELPEDTPQEMNLVVYDPLGRRVHGPVALQAGRSISLDTDLPKGYCLLVLRNKQEITGIRKLMLF